MTTVKADVEQELRADELREILARQQEELDSLKDTISDVGKEFEQEASALSEAGAQAVEASAAAAEPEPTPAPEPEPAAPPDEEKARAKS